MGGNRNLKCVPPNRFRRLRILNIDIHNNALHDLTLIKLTVSLFVSAGSYLDILTVTRNKHIANYRSFEIILKNYIYLIKE